MKRMLLACLAVCMLCALAQGALAENILASFGSGGTADAPAGGGGGDASTSWTYPIPRSILEDSGDFLRLANKSYLLEKDYPDESILVTATVRNATNSELKLRREANDALQTLFNAADQGGIELYLYSAYRSFRTQEILYYNRMQENNGKDDGLVQKEGASDHQTGLGVDVINKGLIGKSFNRSFIDTPEGKWLNDHCAEYGFIIRYLDGKKDITGIQYEPWHLRYVGKEVAQYMMEKGLTLEEFTEEAKLALEGKWVDESTPVPMPVRLTPTEEPTVEWSVDTFDF